MAELLTAPHWQLFTKDQVDLSTVEKEFVEYRETNVSGASTLPRFQLETRDKDAFLLPSEGYVEVRYRMSSTAAPTFTALAASEEIAIQNSAISLFKKTEFSLEDQTVETNDDPGYSYLIKNLSDFSKQYGESIAANEHFYLDTADGFNTPLNGLRFFNANVSNYELFFTSTADDFIPTVATSGNTWAAGNVITITTAEGQRVNTYVKVTASGAETLIVPTNITLTTAAGLLTFAGLVTGAEVSFRVAKTNQPIQVYVNNLPATLPWRVNDLPNPGGANRSLNGSILPAPLSRVNGGFSNRAALVSGGKLASAYIPLKHMFLFCRSFDKVSRGLRIKISLEKQSDSQMIIRSDGANADRFIHIEYISLWIPRVKPDLATLKMVNDNLQSNEIFDVNFTDLSHFRNPTPLTGTAPQSLQISTNSKKPVRVWIALQSTARVNASQTINKRVFDFLGMRSIQVRLNNKIFPAFEYKFESNTDIGVARAYNALMNAAYKMHGSDEGSLITPNQWKNLYPIYYFDLTHQDEDLYKATKTAELEVRWELETPGTGYFVHVVYESERLIKFKGVSGSLAVVM
jgi:hypothetical protein